MATSVDAKKAALASCSRDEAQNRPKNAKKIARSERQGRRLCAGWTCRPADIPSGYLNGTGA